MNIAYNTKLEELQTGNYDSIQIHGQAPDWPEVLAVFAAKPQEQTMAWMWPHWTLTG